MKVDTIGLPSHTTSKLRQTSQSHATHSLRYGVTLAAGLSSVSILCIAYMSLMMRFTRGRLMDRAVCRSFGVSATGAMAF